MSLTSKRIIFLILLAFSAIAFSRTLNVGFIWDDHQMIEANPHIKSITFDNIKHNLFSNIFNRHDATYYRPLQMLSYMADFKFFKLNPSGWHGVNFFLHFLNSFLLFILLIALNFSPQIALVASLFFTVNPMIVEQMLIIAGRAEIMTFTFTLISLIFYLKKGKLNFIISVFSFILALLSKESGIIMPLLLLLCVWFSDEEKFNWKMLTYFFIIPFYLILRSAAVGSSLMQIMGLKFAEDLILRMPFVLFNYISKTLLPFNLHSYNVINEFNIYAYIILALSLCGLIYIVFFKTKNKIFKFAFLWYLAALIPKLPLFGSQNLVLDHWIYPSNVAFFLIMAYFLDKLKNKSGKIAKAFTVIFILMWGIFSNINILQRNTDLKIYKNAIAHKTTDKVYYNLSREYYLAGNFEKSKGILEKLIKKNDDEMFMNSYALCLWKTGNSGKAKNVLRKIIKGEAKTPSTYLNLASIYVSEKKYRAAEKILLTGGQLFPKAENIKIYLARIYNILGNSKKSYKILKEIRKFNPYNAEALLNLGIMEFNKKNYDKSREYFKKSLELNKNESVAKKYIKSIDLKDSIK
ncbi:MAG: tetratricopeptide repeat protein [Elusimicrobiota bacterium]|nr:tetratricopeptide repeat protein [Elusimicrobiota bacterium]